MPELNVLDCRSCGKRLCPPAYACSNCGGADLAAASIPGEGRLYTYTTIYTPPAGFEKLGTYTVAVVEMAGGLRVAGRLRVLPEAVPAIGERVALVAVEDGSYVFAPAA